ncbi:MAG: hypothetical protein ABI399_08925 [Bauldia sp.]
MKFMALYMAPAASIAELMSGTPEQMKDGMKAWMDWADMNKTALMDMGAPLGKTKTVSASGAMDSKNEVTGFSVVEADSADAAAKIFAKHPHLQIKGATIDVMDYVSLPGM